MRSQHGGRTKVKNVQTTASYATFFVKQKFVQYKRNQTQGICACLKFFKKRALLIELCTLITLVIAESLESMKQNCITEEESRSAGNMRDMS